MGIMLVVRYTRTPDVSPLDETRNPAARVVVGSSNSAYDLRSTADEDKKRIDPDGKIEARWTDQSISLPENQAYVMTDGQATLLLRTPTYSWWAEKP